MADYPASLYSHTTLVDGSDYPQAADVNAPANEVVAIETELGTNPKSIDDTVSPGATPASVAAYLDMLANIVKTITGAANWYSAAVSVLTGTMTLTNKRITPRVVAVTPAAEPAINIGNGDVFTITSQAAAITSMTTNLTGTPTSGQQIEIQILDDGTARAITWGASFASAATLPTTTTISKWLYVKLEYSASRTKWICKGVTQEQ